MTGNDVVQRTVDFQTPDRIAMAKGEQSDIGYVNYARADDFRPHVEGIDEWGCVWHSLNPDKADQGQVAVHPLADWDQFERYQFPDAQAPGRFATMPQQVHGVQQAGKYLVGNLGKGPMHLLDDLRGFEQYLCDLLAEPERITAMLDGIFTFLTGITRQYADHGVNAVILWDDQAIQTGPIFSMDLWRAYLKPRYRQLCDLVHERGMRMFMHACGNLEHHLVDLFECGVDVLDNKQPSLWMHSPAVDQVRGKMSFMTCIDIQTTIFTTGVDEIEAEVDRLIRRLSVPEGGFLSTYYHQPDLAIPSEKVERMLQSFAQFHW